jgi:hypothetical protein
MTPISQLHPTDHPAAASPTGPHPPTGGHLAGARSWLARRHLWLLVILGVLSALWGTSTFGPQTSAFDGALYVLLLPALLLIPWTLGAGYRWLVDARAWGYVVGVPAVLALPIVFFADTTGSGAWLTPWLTVSCAAAALLGFGFGPRPPQQTRAPAESDLARAARELREAQTAHAPGG